MSMKTGHGAGTIMSSQRGVALLMVLWIITLLMIIVTSLVVITRTEANSTVFFRNDIQKMFFAEGALERAIMEISYRQIYRNRTVVLEGQETVRVDGRENTGTLGTGRYVFRLYDESGKININRMRIRTASILNNLLVNLGTPKEQADIIVDSISDWIDGDELARLNGAENEYYRSLPNPYDAKNKQLDTLEELLMVKGMSADILYGTKERKGLIHFLTIYSTTNRININAAPKEVLMALPGVTEETVDKIIEMRSTADFKSTQDIQTTGVNYASVARYVDIGESNVYTIESVGFQNEEEKGHGIRAVVSLDASGMPSFRYYKSPAEIRK